jgi:Xaa-Pro aminopeptidase
MSAKRINNLRQLIKKENLDGLIVTDLKQIRYLTGFSGSAALLAIGPKKALFFSDFRYKEQAAKEVKGAKVHIATGPAITALKDFPELAAKNRRLGYAAAGTTVEVLKKLEKSLPGCLWVPADNVLGQLGWVKEKDELVSISKAVEISDVAFERILNLIAPGVRERELAAELEYQMMMLGSERAAFESIVASGWRSALPHGIASNKKLQAGDFVTFDFGATVNGYVSDITRTVVVGKATLRQKKIYSIVARAQLAAIRKMKPGASCKMIDGTARQIITRAGYGRQFGHGLGHGIGLEVHSGPRLSGMVEDKLMVNNVVTVEPGIYIPGWGGVRIEDDVLVTRSGAKVLNGAPKKLLEL